MNILFIGNSYTYYNDMTALFRALAEENGRAVHVDAVTKGGRRLYENLVDGDEYHEKITALLRERRYDVVFLQEQSYMPLVDREAFERGVSGLKRLVSAERTILYATWGRKKGAPLLEEHGWTSEEMTERLEEAYRAVSEIVSAELSPVGRCFRAVARLLPELELYNSDLSHPSHAGSCVAAVTHYACVFGELPKAYAALKLDEKDADGIREAVVETLGETLGESALR